MAIQNSNVVNKKIIPIIIGVIVIGIALAVFFIFQKNETNSNQNQLINITNQIININDNTNSSDENINQTSAITNVEVTVEGMVFLKGYKTPSESFGISTTDGHEIGLGKYDSMKEQFRPYIGDKVKVTFSSVCRTTNPDCCRTLFSYCGTVKSWEPLNLNK